MDLFAFCPLPFALRLFSYLEGQMPGDGADSLQAWEWKLFITGGEAEGEEGSGSLWLVEPPWTSCFWPSRCVRKINIYSVKTHYLCFCYTELKRILIVIIFVLVIFFFSSPTLYLLFLFLSFPKVTIPIWHFWFKVVFYIVVVDFLAHLYYP